MVVVHLTPSRYANDKVVVAISQKGLQLINNLNKGTDSLVQRLM